MNRSQARWLLFVAGVLLWFLAVLPAYYVVHKPLAAGPPAAAPVYSFSAEQTGASLLSLLADLALLALTLIVAAAWGSRIARWLGITFESGLERWSMGATLGLGLLGTLVFGMGIAGALYHWLGYAALILLGGAAVPELRAFIRWLVTSLRRLRPGRTLSLWLYTGLVGVLSLGLALLPPTGWDELVYHLQGPRFYLEAHRLTAVPENFYLNWPAQVEMLFAWGMLLKGDTLAKLLHWAFWPLTAALLYSLTRRAINARAGRWAMALWASVPVAAELAGVAYVDLGLTAFVLAGVYALLCWAESHSNGWLALSAIFVGLAMATKYTAATWMALLVLLLVYHAWRHERKPFGWILARAAGFAAIAGLIALPWLLKNWIVTGNPIYPFLFGGIGWNSTREAWLTWPGQGYSQNLVDYLALPWLLTVLGTNGTAAFDATIGPLLLWLVPMNLAFRRRPQAVNYALALAGAQFLYFAVTIYRYVYLAETRLLLPVFPLLCLSAAFVLSRLQEWDRRALRLSWVVGGVVTAVIASNLLAEAQAFLAIRPLAPLAGLESREGYLTRRLGAYYEASRYLTSHLGAADKPISFWEPRGYYGPHSMVADPTLDNLAQLHLAYGNAKAATAELQARGFTHLLVYQSGLEFIQGPTPRPPTLSSLLGNPPPEESLYPLTEDDLRFLGDLIAQCTATDDLWGIYSGCELPR